MRQSNYFLEGITETTDIIYLLTIANKSYKRVEAQLKIMSYYGRSEKNKYYRLNLKCQKHRNL